MAKIYRVLLSAVERSDLQEIVSRRSEKSEAVKRSYLLLGADEDGPGLPDITLSERYKVSTRTIERLRQRYVEEGLQVALKGKKREVFKEKIFDGEVEAKLLALKCSDPPDGYNKWTLRLLADKMVSLEYVPHMSHEGARQLLKKTS